MDEEQKSKVVDYSAEVEPKIETEQDEQNKSINDMKSVESGGHQERDKLSETSDNEFCVQEGESCTFSLIIFDALI